MVNKLVEGLNFKNGILHIEFMWTDNGLRIIEFALRGCGSNVITHLMPEIRGFDIMKFLLYKSLGVDYQINLTNNAYRTLVQGGSVGSHSLDANAIYLTYDDNGV